MRPVSWGCLIKKPRRLIVFSIPELIVSSSSVYSVYSVLRFGFLSMKFAITIFALFLAGTASAQDAASTAARAHVRFTVENPQLDPADYSLQIYEDGTGSYSVSLSGDSPSQPAVRAIQIHEPLLSRLFEVARKQHFFALDCQAPHSQVAFTGKKTFAYTGPDGRGICIFNYSREQPINQIAADLMSVAFTLQEGVRLASDHLHDRLALDEELESLQEAAQDRRALELENIAPVLESVANDEAVMNRARARARALIVEPASIR